MYYLLGYIVISYLLVYLILKPLSEFTSKLDHLDDSDLGIIFLISPFSIFIMFAFLIVQIVIMIMSPVVDKLGGLFR